MLRRPHRLQLQSTLVPTRRQRAVSAAVVAPPPHRCSRDGHCSCSRCSGRRDGDWWKSCHSTSTSPPREATRTRRSSLPPDVCTDPHGTHAQLAPDCAVGQAAAAASAAPIEPSTSAAQQPASPVRPLSACLPLHPPVACACACSTGLRPGYGCSPTMPNWLRVPAMLAALRRQTTWVPRRQTPPPPLPTTTTTTTRHPHTYAHST